MKTNSKLIWIIGLAAISNLLLFDNRAVAYRVSDLVLRDSDGNPIALGSNTPYSPKKTCGTVECHIDMVRSFGLTSGNIYESEIRSAAKDHGRGSPSYAVPYAEHGVSAGYHFQTGNSTPWGDVQRNYYKDIAFSSSPGAYGGYCPSYSRRLADLTEIDSARFDMSSYDFSRSACALCHGGGGPLEYDREGFRYNGTSGLFQAGSNQTPEWGDYYTYDPATGSLADKTSQAQAGGVAEVDCLICHLRTDGMRYGLVERNFALSESGAPGLAASLGLAGAAGTTGYLSIAQRAEEGANPVISTSTWSWTTVALDHAVLESPAKENCALCHFADKDFLTAGPAGKPLGFTVFQKILPAGTTQDGDSTGGGANAVDWKNSVPRPGSAFRGGSINDTVNTDVHMDNGDSSMECITCHYLLGTYRDSSTDCQYCHYNYWGYSSPPAVTPVTPTPYADFRDQNGAVIQPGVSLFRIDHQFAKGDSSLKDMDQLDNTVTCASCHVDRTHPNTGDAPGIAVHNGLPTLHFDKIACRTCHIPILNGPVDRTLIDLTVGPYQTFDRTQTVEAETTGINKRPLYLWRATESGKGPIKIQSFNIVTTAGWAEALSQSGEGAVDVEPALERIGKTAAEQLREQYGDSDDDGLYDWSLNRAQGGDTTLIVNKASEITGFIGRMQSLTGAPANPVISFSFGKFSVSHNLPARSSARNPILGSPSGGGCVMCHSSSDPSNPNYSPQSVGFFDKTYELFQQPADGGDGLVQTQLPSAPPLSGNLERVHIAFPYLSEDGTSGTVDLSNSAGTAVGDSINQGQVLGYDAARRESLMAAKTATYTITASAGANGSIAPSGAVAVNAGKDQTFTIWPETGYKTSDVLVDGASVGNVSTYTFTYVIAPHTLEAVFMPDVSYTITATAGPNGSISPSGSSSVLKGGKITYTITPGSGYRIASVLVDGVSVGAASSYTFSNVTADHTISASFASDTFTITATAYAGGTIAPAGDTAVPRGGSQTYTITPNAGYSVSFVQVDGVNKGAITVYTFTNVTAAHKIKAYFKIP
jgi:hypothetical protein